MDGNDLPEGLEPKRHRDLRGRGHEPWVRRIVVCALLAVLALGLANVLGQRATSSSASEAAARLSVTAPQTLRGGLLWQGVIRVEARARIARPRIVLGRGWLEGMTINTVVPEAADQADYDGRLVLAYGELPAGDALTVRIALQVNSTTLGREPQDVELRDGDTPLARVERNVTVLP